MPCHCAGPQRFGVPAEESRQDESCQWDGDGSSYSPPAGSTGGKGELAAAEQLLPRCHPGTRVSDNVECCSSLSDGDWAAVAFPLSRNTGRSWRRAGRREQADARLLENLGKC